VAELLVVRNLVRRFGDRTVLDRLSFELDAGEVCAVVGPNGAGKTTLLRCVVGADRADGGSIRLAGRQLVETDPWVRASVASVLDDVDFFPDLSVREHLDLLAFGHGTPDAAGTVERIVAELGLDEAQDQLPATLSSGQRRRAALASCFVRAGCSYSTSRSSGWTWRAGRGSPARCWPSGTPVPPCCWPPTTRS
jgi:ABC-type multidrug transport system ATPase subunit